MTRGVSANAFISYLSSSLAQGGSESTIYLSTIQTLTGETITTADFATLGKGRITIDPLSTTNIEFASFTAVDGTNIAVTGATRGLSANGDDTSSTRAKYHPVGTIVILSFGVGNIGDMLDYLVSKTTNETISGLKTFTTSPIVPTPTTNYQAATKKYADDIVSGGVGTATNSTYGTTKMSVAIATPNTPIAVGDNDPRVPTQAENDALVGNNTDIAVGSGNKFITQTGLQHGAEKYAADAGSNDTYVITLSPVPTSYTAGMVVHFKANTINTGACTLNVNSLGAKTIKKSYNIDLNDGDIKANQLVTVIYDGTNFQMISPVANSTTYANGVQNLGPYTTAATNDTTITTGFLPRTIKIYYYVQGHGGTISFDHYLGRKGIAIFNGTTLIADCPFWDMNGQAANSYMTDDNGVPYNLGDANAGFFSTVNSTSAIASGPQMVGSGDGDIKTAISIDSISSTGFVFRVVTTTSAGSNTNNARADFTWEAFA